MKNGLAAVWAFKKIVVSVAAVAVLALGGCASRPRELASNCLTPSEKPTAELLFGRLGDGAPNVSEAEFTRFLNSEVSPRFPDGLTVVNAKGGWTLPTGSDLGQRPKLVMIVLHGGSDDQAKLMAIRTVYQARYHQQSVLLPTGPGCLST